LKHADSERRERKFKIQHDRLVEWSDIFDDSSFDEKKMIVYQLADKVFVDIDYEISIEFTETLKEYLEFSEHDLKICCLDYEYATSRICLHRPKTR
jgi:hypothetical protein